MTREEIISHLKEQARTAFDQLSHVISDAEKDLLADKFNKIQSLIDGLGGFDA